MDGFVQGGDIAIANTLNMAILHKITDVCWIVCICVSLLQVTLWN